MTWNFGRKTIWYTFKTAQFVCFANPTCLSWPSFCTYFCAHHTHTHNLDSMVSFCLHSPHFLLSVERYAQGVCVCNTLAITIPNWVAIWNPLISPGHVVLGCVRVCEYVWVCFGYDVLASNGLVCVQQIAFFFVKVFRMDYWILCTSGVLPPRIGIVHTHTGTSRKCRMKYPPNSCETNFTVSLSCIVFCCWWWLSDSTIYIVCH